MRPLTIVLLGATWLNPCAVGQSEASLTIRFQNGSSFFHVGEIIPIELTFDSSVEKTYEVSMRTYDRSGRLDIDQFHVSPPGSDPLDDYYHSVFGFMGGGLSGIGFLGRGKPWLTREDLNEWVALDRPGHYALSVTSNRVTRQDGPKPEPLELRSNTLEFDVVDADPAWQQQTLASALSTLDDPGASKEARRSAMRVLRFLDSPASTREFVQRLTTSGEWDFVAGTFGSSHREIAVREFDALLASPDVAITREYLTTYARIKFLSSHEPLPPYPDKDKEQQAAWNKKQGERLQQLNVVEDGLYRETAALVGKKVGAARAETVRTLLERPSDAPLTGLSDQEIQSAFLALPERQASLLQSNWARLKSPAMAGALETILDKPHLADASLRNAALSRLYEIDPDAARTRILAEIQKPHADAYMPDAHASTFGGNPVPAFAKTLGMLPDETLPQFDDILATRLERRSSMELDAPLIGRYATKTVLARVKAVYETAPQKWSCVVEDGLISYFLRVDADYGIERARAVNSFCLAESLKTVIRMKRWAEVEAAIIQKLSDSNLWTARQAADTLAKYGGAASEKALWERLRRFHTQWKERERELESRPNMSRDANDAISLQYGLVEALGRAHGWVLTDEQIGELEKLTLGQERENVARWHWQSPVSLTLVAMPDNGLRAEIGGQYSLDDAESLVAKLAQFPRGTRFSMNSQGPPERIEPVLRAVRETAEKAGIIVENATGN